MIKSDSFGFINYSSQINFINGHITPTDNFNKVCNWIAKYKNTDGFIYPPMEHRVKYDKINGKKGNKIPNTERPSLLHRLPASHVLTLDVDEAQRDALRKADSGFIVHLLSYIFGTRLQFHDWWFDNRVPIEPTHNINFHREFYLS